jgi:hypothetical protein
VVSLTPRPLYPEEKAPGTHWIGGWVDPGAGLDDFEERKFLTLPGLELRPLGRPARSQSLYRLRYPAPYFFSGLAAKILIYFPEHCHVENLNVPSSTFHVLLQFLVSCQRICASSKTFLIFRNTRVVYGEGLEPHIRLPNCLLFPNESFSHLSLNSVSVGVPSFAMPQWERTILIWRVWRAFLCRNSLFFRNGIFKNQRYLLVPGFSLLICSICQEKNDYNMFLLLTHANITPLPDTVQNHATSEG